MNLSELHTAAAVIMIFVVFPKQIIICETADNTFKFYTEK